LDPAAHHSQQRQQGDVVKAALVINRIISICSTNSSESL
jgi:hypothetical protein